MVCGETGLRPEDIVYERANTIDSPDSGTTSGSRQTLITGEAVRMAQAHGIDAPVTCRYYEGLKERAAAFSK